MPKKIEKLEDLVGPETLKKLEKARIKTLEDLASATVPKVSEIEGISENRASELIGDALEATGQFDLLDGNELKKIQSNRIHITTGSKELDELVDQASESKSEHGRGVESQQLYEFYGKESSGKTQLALTLAVNVQLPLEKGGLNGKVLFMDTEGTFSMNRYLQIAKLRGLTEEQANKNLNYVRVRSSEHQVALIPRVREALKADPSIKLIIVDSLISFFRLEFVGRQDFPARAGVLNPYLHDLQGIADRYNLVVYVTNQVHEDPSIIYGDPTRPVGGRIVGHATTRIYLRHTKGNSRVAKIMDSHDLPDVECVFYVTNKGVTDEEKD